MGGCQKDPWYEVVSSWPTVEDLCGNFSKDTLKDYFLVMAEPKPGLAGAVRHWHYRCDGGNKNYF
ncbi:MAG: hypothetical protein K6T65_15815 [Peptococcaceae bacterium]|nr:hypothetical protein [Peptococcaceae bacterium]